MRAGAAAVLLMVLASACAGPPPSAYVGGHGAHGGEVGLGRIASGESCSQQPEGGGAVIYCGTWAQPSGHVEVGGAATPAALTGLATTSAWRSGLDSRYKCGEPASTTILGDAPGIILSCNRRVGGWPQVALVAIVRGSAYYADGIAPAAPALERGIGVLSGRVTPAAAPDLPPGGAEALVAQRLAARSFSAGDIGQFQELMLAGLRANLAENYVAAEQAYRAALQLQSRAIGPDNPATATPMMQLALQLSNQGRTSEADRLFATAAPLAARSDSRTALARLDHYRALGDLNEDKAGAALNLLRGSEARYVALLPPELLAVGPDAGLGGSFATTRSGAAGASFSSDVPLQPDQQVALIGVIESRRYQAIALRTLHREAESRAMIRSAMALAGARGLRQENLTARLHRTDGLVEDAGEAGSGASFMRLAAADFAEAEPGSRPLAQTYLLRAAELVHSGAPADAISECRRASLLLDQMRAGTSAALMSPCLTAYAAQAQLAPADRQHLLAEMFEDAQLVQGSVTSQQIALATARLTAGAGKRQVGEAIRRQQDAALALAQLEQQRDEGGAAKVPAGAKAADDADLGRRVASAEAALADADTVLQDAAPNYAQLVQQVASAADVLTALTPGEAFAAIIFTPDGGWVFVLRDGQIAVAPTGANSSQIAALVQQVRGSVVFTTAEPPPFATAAAAALYADTLGRLAPELAGAHALIVAPAGALLAMPLELMLTGPADPSQLATAPWLVRQVAISHVPAPANFVTLRKAAHIARAVKPWFGFGDFRPVTLAQAEDSFPSADCADSARLFAGLPPLPYAAAELASARSSLGGAPDDALLGASFTAPEVLRADLRPYRILHFATHALLPTDLRCQSEPAIVASSPAGARNAAGALLSASDVMGLQLNADVVIISACNSAGPDGSPAGESLSGLARAFFYAGARAVMVTHWSVNDNATAYLVASTLKRLGTDPRAGVAEALRQTQLAMLAQAGHGLPAKIAHPFYWGAFGLVGEGGGAGG